MEVWLARAVAASLLLASHAPAHAQEVTVFFGAPAETPEVVDLTPARCPSAVTIERRFDGRRESMRMPLLDCAREPRPEAIRALSVLARPRTMPAPSEEDLSAHERDPVFAAEGIRRAHPALLDRLARVAEAFEGHAIEIHSGYRPNAPVTSRHHHGRALDLSVIGVPREALRDLLRTFEETGVGWYPNSTFVHLDVREESEYWIDVSRPGEAPRYIQEEIDLDALRRETEAILRSISIAGPPD